MDPSLLNVPSINSNPSYCHYGAVYDESLRYETWCRLVTQFPTASCKSPLLTSAADNKCIGPLVIARLVSPGRLAPRSYRVTAAGGLTFAAAMRVVDRVHRDATVGRVDALPPVASRLADGDVLVV